jgi:hypothetical protein
LTNLAHFFEQIDSQVLVEEDDDSVVELEHDSEVDEVEVLSE